MHRRPFGLLTVLALVPLLSGCAGVLSPAASPPARVITADEIERLGAHDAWEALERSGTALRSEEIGRSRSASHYITDIPRVIVDGVQMLEIRLLRDIPASLISRIWIESRPSRLWRSDDPEAGATIRIETRGRF
jgi:hypothetical protein